MNTEINLIASNQNFIRLNKLLNKFNVFEATDMGRREIKHTKFLAYLLDPNESHGLGDWFLTSFLANLPCADQIPLMGLHTTLTVVKPEWNSIDIYVKIPMHEGRNFLHLFIENKLAASQSVDQLKTYSKTIETKIRKEDKEEIKIKLFLTQSGEQSQHEGWFDMTYGENVIPALKQTIEFRGDVISEYLKQILSDYADLITKDIDRIDYGQAAEDIAAKILEDKKILHFTKDKSGRNSTLEYRNLQIKFAKAYSYLQSYDSDPRTRNLRSWEKLEKQKPYKLEIEGNPYILSIESSTRSYRRFTILTAENRKMLAEQASTKKWLDSGFNIAFEIYLKPVDSENTLYESGAVLILGPLELDRTKFVEQFTGKPNDKPTTPYYTRLIAAKDLLANKNRTLDDLNTEISKSLFNFKALIADEKAAVILNPALEIAVVKLNSTIKEYFNSHNEDQAKTQDDSSI